MILVVVIMCGFADNVEAWFETGVETGFVTNINRPTDGGDDDWYVSVAASAGKGFSGESRTDWILSAVVSGVSYMKYDYLNYVSLSLRPGLVIVPHASWSITLLPFASATSVKDNDQSSIAFGGRAVVEKNISSSFYSGLYYQYTDSTANAKVYSFSRHAAGLYLGSSPAGSFSMECGYEYAHGESFRSVRTSSTMASGHGRHQIFSRSFGSYVVQDTVTRHTFWAQVSLSLTKALSASLGFAPSFNQGDLGSYTSQTGYLGLSYSM